MINKVVLLICLVQATVEIVLGSIETKADCPGTGIDEHGYWIVDSKDGQPRCILKCYPGFEPDGCHVLRKKPTGKWNYKEPHCVKKTYRPRLKTVANVGAVVGTGAAAVLAAPVALSVVGFTSAGVAAGSFAAALQGPATVAGSLFALAQSAGAAGLAATTQAGLFAITTAFTGTFSSLIGRCEPE